MKISKNSKIYEDWRKIKKWFKDNNTNEKKKIDAINKMLMMESLVRLHIEKYPPIKKILKLRNLMIGKGCVRKYNFYSGDCDLLIYSKNDVKRNKLNGNGKLEDSKTSHRMYDNILLYKPKCNFIIVAIESKWLGFNKLTSKEIRKKFAKQFLGIYFNGNHNPKKNNKIFKIMNEEGWNNFHNHLLRLIKEL